MSNIKFEHVFAGMILLILSAALYLFRADKDIVNILVTALVGAFSAITAFFFTKYSPNSSDNKE
jgi:uncharacterized membrane protein